MSGEQQLPPAVVGDRFEVLGVLYEAVEEQEPGSCGGCDACDGCEEGHFGVACLQLPCCCPASVIFKRVVKEEENETAV